MNGNAALDLVLQRIGRWGEAALPAAGPLDPFEWSHLCGLANPVGVSWDYYGNPFRARPAIGAVEIPPTF